MESAEEMLKSFFLSFFSLNLRNPFSGSVDYGYLQEILGTFLVCLWH